MPSDLTLLIIELIALLVGLISAWILGIRMQRRIRRALGRKVEDTDLNSLRTWMAVEEAEKEWPRETNSGFRQKHNFSSVGWIANRILD